MTTRVIWAGPRRQLVDWDKRISPQLLHALNILTETLARAHTASMASDLGLVDEIVLDSSWPQNTGRKPLAVPWPSVLQPSYRVEEF
jgi:hypothetical protein